MAWSYRKRIKIAPGVSINLSKSGVSTSVGPTGARVTFGPKGTFLHTSIPGTGIYSRKKIGSGFGATSQTSNLSSTDSINNITMSTPKKPEGKKGCLPLLLWGLFVIIVILIVVFADNIRMKKLDLAYLSKQVEATAESHYDYSSNSTEKGISGNNGGEQYSASTLGKNDLTKRIEDIEDDLKVNYYVIASLAFLACLNAVWLISHYAKKTRKKKQKNAVPPEISRLRLKTLTASIIDKSPVLISTRSLQKSQILNNYLGHLILEDAEKRLKPLVEKWTRKADRNPSPKNTEQLRLYEEQYNSAIKEAEEKVYDIDADLSEQEKRDYKSFCSAFQSFKDCKKTWIVLSSSRELEYKSSATTRIEKATVLFTTGYFSHLTSSFNVPVFPGQGKEKLYIYPRFIIKGSSIDDYRVAPISDISFRYKPTRYIEEGIRPADSKQVDTTYKYINKNGSPDKRYSYNPSLPVLLYGDISISPYGETYQVSNCDAAIRLERAFNVLKEGYLAKKEDGIVGSNQLESKPEVVSEDNKPSIEKLTLDERFEEAARMVVLTQSSSISDLQRKLGLGYARAGRILDQLEVMGIVGPQIGSFPRQVLVHDFSELDRILKKNDSTSLSTERVSEQYFNDLLDASKHIYEFKEKLANDKDFCEIVTDTISGSVCLNGKTLSSPQERMPIYLLADVSRCYEGLGHGLDLSSNEGLGLLMFITHLVRPDFNMQYRYLDIMRQNLKEPCESFARDALAPLSGKKDVFLLELCLRRHNKRLHNQYVVLLYRFASLIAKADKNITTTEANWLNRIMSLKEQEDMADVLAPSDSLEKAGKAMSRKPSSRAIKELNSLIGLASVKSEINTLANYIKVQNMRAEKGMKVSPVSYHCVFTGNPGTGKTTVARIVSEIYKELGILKKGHLVETDRSGLVAEYVGQTAVKTNKIIDSALDGVLFIDEAYSLVDGGNSDYGKEAISTLLKRMEDNRDRLVVILAGYTNDMKRFIESNPGLQSRFNRYIEFPDYTAEELYQIFESNTRKYEYKLTEAAASILKGIFEKAVEEKDKNFGNGRFVRNMFEKVVENQANRISSVADITADSLATIEAEDISNSL